MPSPTDPVTLRFHRRDRPAIPCGQRGKHPLYWIETPSGSVYVVRRKALAESAKGYTQATEVAGLDLVGTVWGDTPIAALAKAHAVAGCHRAAKSCDAYAAGTENGEKKNHETYEALLRGEEVPYRGADEPWRMHSHDAEAETITCEVFYTEDHHKAKWGRERDAHEAGLAAALEAGDERAAREHGYKKEDGSWECKGFERREPIGEWFLPTWAEVVLEHKTAEIEKGRRDGRNLFALAMSFESGLAFKLEKAATPSLEATLAIVTAQQEREVARKAKSKSKWERNWPAGAWTQSVAGRLGCTPAVARKLLAKLAKAGKLVDNGKGHWSLVEVQS